MTMRSESINILKDTAATAIYGSPWVQWCNCGCHETTGGRQVEVNAEIGNGYWRLRTWSSYDLLNAAEKLQLEKMAGLYDTDFPGNDVKYSERYNKRLKACTFRGGYGLVE